MNLLKTTWDTIFSRINKISLTIMEAKTRGLKYGGKLDTGHSPSRIHKDLIKIKDGVYQNELGSTLLYIIFGPNSGKAFDFEMFEYDFNEAKRNGNPHCENTTVIIDDTPTLEHLRAFLVPTRMAAK